jgi:DNA-binding CsgD family transcriptional regulator
VTLAEREAERAATDALVSRGGVLVVEAGAGIGKTALLDEASCRARAAGRDVLIGRGSELEADFPFGVVRQLFEPRLATADRGTRAELLAGPARAAARPLLSEAAAERDVDTSFAVLHGLYWLAVNMADRCPLLIVVDDMHWADPPSLRWLAHVAPRIEGCAIALLVATRPIAPVLESAPLQQLRACATVVRPHRLSPPAVTTIARGTWGSAATDAVCAELCRVTGGNPFYLVELLRGGVAALAASGGRPDGITRHVVARLRRLEPGALTIARSLSILHDGCALRDAAAVAGVDVPAARRAAAELVRAEVLAEADPPRFLHPIIREAVDATLGSDEREAAHAAAAHVLWRERAPAAQVATHLVRCQPAEDPWVVDRLREAARAAMGAAAPHAAAQLLTRALAEPPPEPHRVEILRELARAEVGAGHDTACATLEEARALADDPRTRAEIALEMAAAYAGLFRWVEAVDVVERALAELAGSEPDVADRLAAALVVSGLHDARRAASVEPALDHLASRPLTGAPAEARAVAVGMRMVLGGRPATEAAAVLEPALATASVPVDDWDVRAALLWCLITAERFDAVEAALGPLSAEVERTGSARGLVAVYSSMGLLQLRLGALPEADAAAGIALRVLRAGDFGPGLAFGATVLADVAIEAGQLDQAAELLGLLPAEPMPPGVGSVLVPAARGRLHLAHRRWREALDEFEACSAMFSAEVWGIQLRDAGYVHARSGAALALLALGRRDDAGRVAEAELADVHAFGAPRALGVASRVAGLVAGGQRGLELLDASAAALRRSPALLERAKSLLELGAAMRRAGRRRDACVPLAEALELAARCGARPLAARARAELITAGARPRRAWQHGVEALTPSELRVAHLACEGRSNREIAHALYVTVKTVEGHLARTYDKLGISGRAGLVAALGAKDQGGHPVVQTPDPG